MIEIYGGTKCSKCNIIKSKLDDKKIKYTYSEDKDKVMEMGVEYGARSLPICIVDDEYYSFSEMVKWINH